ncbi:MAG: DinB family protein [Gemmatimonadales bacterium]
MSVYSNPASAARDHAEAYIPAVLGLLGDREPRAVLRETPLALAEAIRGLPETAYHAAEARGKWSIGEVLQHLADSELVWGYRLRMALAHDRPQLFGYDQDLWASRLHYADTDPQESLELFTILRHANLRVLDGASHDDMDRVAVHKERGEESIRHMIRLYAGHDLVHLRQIDRIRHSVV